MYTCGFNTILTQVYDFRPQKGVVRNILSN